MKSTIFTLIALTVLSTGCSSHSRDESRDQPAPEAWSRTVNTQSMDYARASLRPATLDHQQRHVRGQRVYRRSCVNCHGIQPRDLLHADPESSVTAVLDGSGAMPALGFKLDAAEVSLALAYVAVCSRDYGAC